MAIVLSDRFFDNRNLYGAQIEQSAMRAQKINNKTTGESIENFEADAPQKAKNAFKIAAESANEIVRINMQTHLLEPAAQNEYDYIDRALILRTQSAMATVRANAEDAVKTQNLILASRGKPPITPAEERRLLDRIQTMAKQELVFLDVFIGKMRGASLQTRG